ncbi:MAG TPA: hypothetical protein VKE40_01405, partial [Gemmataceae bacterium]|nr:hypothetical protein [Gemmataceae bacterium]
VFTVSGDQLDNTINIAADATGNLIVNGGVVLIFGGAPTVANTTLIRLLGNRGNDTLQVLGALPAAVINGGPGNDTLAGGDGADTLFGGGGNDAVDGNKGDDIAFLGLGNDTFTWDPGDGNDRIEGESGQDRMVFNGANLNEVFEFLANGTRLKFTRDLGNIIMDVGGVETVDVNALGGVDKITVNNLAATAVRQINLNLSGTPGGAVGDGLADQVILNGTALNDIVTVAGTGTSATASGLPATVSLGAADPGDSLTVNTLGGHDKVTATGLVAGVLQFTADGGDGNDSLFGSQGADNLLGEAGNDFIFGDNGDDNAFMGAGNDTFQWDPGDGNDTLEGQDGTDRMLFNGANGSENIDISANGQRVRFFRNVGSVTMDLNDVERIDFNAKGGVDNIVVHDLTGTDVNDIRLDLGANPGVAGGDGAPDSVLIEGTNGNDAVTVATVMGHTHVTGLAARVMILSAEAQTDQLTVSGQGGDDSLQAGTLAVTGPLLTLDGGAGNDRLGGSAGDDVLLGGDGNDTVLGQAGDDLIDAGAGDDSIAGGAGEDILNGGDGTDSIDGGAGLDVAFFGEVVVNV